MRCATSLLDDELAPLVPGSERTGAATPATVLQADWRLLLQIDSDDDNTGIVWGAVGTYFMISKNDLGGTFEYPA